MENDTKGTVVLLTEYDRSINETDQRGRNPFSQSHRCVESHYPLPSTQVLDLGKLELLLDPDN